MTSHAGTEILRRTRQIHPQETLRKAERMPKSPITDTESTRNLEICIGASAWETSVSMPRPGMKPS